MQENPEDTLHEFGALWRSLPQQPGQSRPVADVGRRRRAQRVYLAVELAIALTGIVVGAYLAWDGAVTIGIAAIVYSLFGGGLGWWTRGGNINALSASVAEHLAGSTAMLRARRNHNTAGVAMFVAAVVFYGYVRRAQMAAFSPTDLLVVLALVGMAAWYLRRARRAQHDLADHATRLAALGASVGETD